MARPDPVDPTQNVLDLVHAEARRQDDLRKADARRQDDLRQMEQAYHQHVSELRHMYERELRAAETARIDAIRAVDVGAVTRAAEAQALTAQTLAAQTTAMAETFRMTLDTSLQKIAVQIAELQRAQYETQGGKQQVVETRASTGETRLNLGTVISIGAFIAIVIGLIVSSRL